MKSVRDILKLKGTEVWCVEPDATVFQALQRMAEKEVGALVVMEGGQVVGLISEREYARKVVLLGRTSPTSSSRSSNWCVTSAGETRRHRGTASASKLQTSFRLQFL